MREQNESERDLFTPFQPKNKFVNLLFQNNQASEVTYGNSIICFLITSVIFIGLSIFFFIAVGGVIQYEYKYYTTVDNKCGTGATCNVTITVDKYMQQPIYFMYELGNFYQNHRRYIQSKNNFQLAGNQISMKDAGTCYPFITNGDMLITQSWGGNALNASDIASPCGSIAYTFFNDTFALYNSSTIQIPINQTGISWTGDVGTRFKKSANSSATQWIDPENEHFIVWMRTSGLPNFKKVWGRIEQDLPAGTYYVVITNNYNSTDWNGDRSFILTTKSVVGGKNFLLPVAFLLIGLISAIAAVVFWRRFKVFKKYNED